MPKGYTTRNNFRVGQETGLETTRTIGSIMLQQTEPVSAVASVAGHMFTLPISAEISQFEVNIASAMNTAATFNMGWVGTTAGNSFGAVAVSAVGVYTITNPATAGTWRIGSSAQAIGYTVTPQSGAATMAIGNSWVRVVYGVDYHTFDT